MASQMGNYKFAITVHIYTVIDGVASLLRSTEKSVTVQDYTADMEVDISFTLNSIASPPDKSASHRIFSRASSSSSGYPIVDRYGTITQKTSYYEGGGGSAPIYKYYYVYEEEPKRTVAVELFKDAEIGDSQQYSAASTGQMTVDGVTRAVSLDTKDNCVRLSTEIYESQTVTGYYLPFYNNNLTNYPHLATAGTVTTNCTAGTISSQSGYYTISGTITNDSATAYIRIKYQYTHNFYIKDFSGVTLKTYSSTVTVNNGLSASPSYFTLPSAGSYSGGVVSHYSDGLGGTMDPGDTYILPLDIDTPTSTVWANFYSSFGPYTVNLSVGAFTKYADLFASCSTTYHHSGGGSASGNANFNGAYYTISGITFAAKSTSDYGTLTISRTTKGYTYGASSNTTTVTGGSAVGSVLSNTISTIQIKLSNLIDYPVGTTITISETLTAPYTIKVYDYKGNDTGNACTGTVTLSPTMSLYFNRNYTLYDKPISNYDKFLGWASSSNSSSANVSSYSLNSYDIGNSGVLLRPSFSVSHSYSSSIASITHIIYEAWTTYANLGTFTIQMLPRVGDFSDTLKTNSLTANLGWSNSFEGNQLTVSVSSSINSSNSVFTATTGTVSKSAKNLIVQLNFSFLDKFNGNMNVKSYTVSPYGSAAGGTGNVSTTKTCTITIPFLKSDGTVNYDLIDGNHIITVTQHLCAQVSVNICSYDYVSGSGEITNDISAGEVEITNSMTITFKMPAGKLWGYPNSRYDTFLGWSENKESSTIKTGWGPSVANTTTTYSYSYQKWRDEKFCTLQFIFFEAWKIETKVGNYSFIVKCPGGIKDIDKAFLSRNSNVKFYDENKALATTTHSISVAEQSNGDFKITCSGSTTLSQLDKMVYIEFNMTYTESAFLMAANEKEFSTDSYAVENNTEIGSISVRYYIPTLVANSSPSLHINFIYKYKLTMRYCLYDGTATSATTSQTVALINNQLSTSNFKAPERYSNPDNYKLWWFFKGWSKTPQPDNVDEDKNVYVAPTYKVGDSITHTISYTASSAPTTEFRIYEIFKLGYGYVVYLTYVKDHNEMALIPSTVANPQIHTEEAEDSKATVTITLKATRAVKRGFHFNKWTGGDGVKSISGTTCVVDLSETEPSPETTRLRIKRVNINANWTPITWKRNMKYNKNTSKSVSNWKGGTSTTYTDSHSWTFNYTDIDEVTGQTKESFVVLNGEKSYFYLPIEMPGLEPEYLRTEDDYQLSEWTETPIADTNESEVTPSYIPGERYDFREKVSTGWYNSTESSGTLEILLYARWVEGTLAYIWVKGYGWCRGIPYIYDGGWKKAVIK